jgi:hypothetical protein
MKLDTKTYVKAGILAVGVIAALVLVTTHPIISAVIVVVGVAYFLIDSGKVNVG